MKAAGNIFSRAIKVLYPDRCAFCGAVIRPYGKVCAQCMENLPQIEKKICRNCGREKEYCNCRGKHFEFSGCVAPFYYEGLAKKGILRIKFLKKPSGAKMLAEYAARTVRREYADIPFDLVTSVPLSRRELQRRGFNQSAVFAKALAAMLAIPYKETLEKPLDTRPQRSCTARERWGNVFGEFRVRETVAGETILLADDIITTGATLNECAKMLRIAGAREVWCVTEACVKSIR